MMEVLQQFTTSLTVPAAPVVHAVQYDAVRRIRLRLYSGATVWHTPDGVTAGVSYTLPNRKTGYFERLTDGTNACMIDGNEVEAAIPPAMTGVAGTVQAAIVLRLGAEQLSTFPFQIKVAARPGGPLTPEAAPDAVSAFSDRLYYGSASGLAIPLEIGPGLRVENNVLEALADPNAASKGYVDDAISSLRADLMYRPIEISGIRHEAGVQEMGASVKALTVSWELSKAPYLQTLDGMIVAPEERSVVLSRIITETTAFTLRVEDERGATDEAGTTVYFYNGVYFGALYSDVDAVDSAAILSLERKLQSGRSVDFTVTPGVGKRPVYACPVRYGIPVFRIRGFEYSWDKIGTIRFVNGSGYAEDYDVWMHPQNVTGNVTVNVS